MNAENSINEGQKAIVTNKKLSARLVVHNGMLIPTLMYGFEACSQGRMKVRLNAVEMRSVRHMHGKMYDRVTNVEPRNECKFDEKDA